MIKSSLETPQKASIKNQQIHITRFLIIVTMALIGCYIGLTPGRTAGAGSAHKTTYLLPSLRGEAAIGHLKQTGLYNSLSAAVTAARYQIEERKGVGYQASKQGHGYRTIFTREGVELSGASRTGQGWRLWLKLSGDLKARLAESGQAILLNGRGAGARLRYEKLQSFDAMGREMEARMKLEGDEVKLEVEGEGAIYPVTIDPTFTQQQKLEASDAAEGDFFGFSVAISGETVVVGAPFDEGAAGIDQGSAYVFVRSAGGWTQQQKLEAADPAEGDQFGNSVAISGETIVVGALLDDGAAGFEQGSAYVFVRSAGVWTQQQKLEAADAAQDDRFGTSVAISGETVVIGAPGDDGAAGSVQGSAYVFVRSAGGWTQQQKLEAADAAEGDFFGNSVAVSGETVVAGAFGDSGAAGFAQGSAYVFVHSAGVWTQQQKLEAADPAEGDFFGFSVAISGETVVAGARGDDGAGGSVQGSAYVFVRSGGVWTQQQKLEAADPADINQFGTSVTISGETIVAGAPGDDGAAGFDQGSAYVFVRSAGVWSQQQKLRASDPAEGDQFGFSVAISGETVVAGAPGDDGAAGFDQGSAYVFGSANRPPNCSGAFPSVSTIRPPNRKFVNGTIRGVADPDGDLVTINIDRIKQDEPTDSYGDGQTCPDGQGIGTSTAQLRAERSGQGNGRVYTIFFTASDGRGGSCQGSVTVCVPRTKKRSCTNGGAIFDSTDGSGFSGSGFSDNRLSGSHSNR
jgi:FG-GAP repeat